MLWHISLLCINVILLLLLFSYNFVLDLVLILFYGPFLCDSNFPRLSGGIVHKLETLTSQGSFYHFCRLCGLLSGISWPSSLPLLLPGFSLPLSLLSWSCSIFIPQSALSHGHGPYSGEESWMISFKRNSSLIPIASLALSLSLLD